MVVMEESCLAAGRNGQWGNISNIAAAWAGDEASSLLHGSEG
jgi:hypothetical protein